MLHNTDNRVRSGVVRDNTLFLVASPRNATRECTIYSLKLRDFRSKFNKFVFDDLKGITDCR